MRKEDKFTAYLAGGIFTYGDELRNREWAKKIREAFPNIDLYSPIENTAINGVEGKKKFAGSKEIEKADNERLDNTDVLIACIDGDVLPSGTCAEIGIMREKIRQGANKIIIGICTDNRECSRTHSEAKDKGGANDICESQYSYQNLYVVGCIKSSGKLVNNIEDAIKYLKTVKLDGNDEPKLEDNFQMIDKYDMLPEVCRRCKYRDSHPYLNPYITCNVNGSGTITTNATLGIYNTKCYNCKNYKSLLTIGDPIPTTPNITWTEPYVKLCDKELKINGDVNGTVLPKDCDTVTWTGSSDVSLFDGD